MHGRRWVPPDPVFVNDDGTVWRPPGHKRKSGRSPIETQFKRTDETRARDERALAAREIYGLSYQRIADTLGYNSKQAAHAAAKRAAADRIAIAKAIASADGKNPQQSPFDEPPAGVTLTAPRRSASTTWASGSSGRGHAPAAAT